MKKILLFILLVLICFVQLSAQFRMVGTGSWTTINDSTYTATVVFQSDLTGNGYVATQITTAFRLFTGTEKTYTIEAVSDATFSSAFLRVVEYDGTQGAPSGQVMVYNPDSRTTIPQVPYGSTGATAQLQAAVVTYNSKKLPVDIVTSGTFNGNSITLVKSSGNITFAGTILSTSTNANLGEQVMAFGDCASGMITFTLPEPGAASGKSYKIVKTDVSTNPLRLSGTFSGGSVQKLIYTNDQITITSNGSVWYHN